MISQVRIKDHWTEQRMFFHRSLAAGVVMLALVLALLGKLVQLQIVRHDYYADLSAGNRVRIDPVPPNRGLILDRTGAVLAENLPAYQLELIAEQVPDIEAALRSLASLGLITDEDVPRLERLIKSRRSFESVPIRLQLTDEEVARFAVNRHDYPGIDIRTRLTRYYPNGAIGVHALGYVSAISEQDLARIDQGEYAGTTLIGKIGIESSFERELHGAPGFRQVLVNAQGRPVELTGQLQSDLSSKSAMSGNDLILSLDLRVQRAAEEALKDHRGAVVAIDPNNGDVIAFASTPGFDPNPFGRGLTTAEYDALQNNIDRPLFNRALRGVYPPGSTIKPVIALAALDAQSVEPAQIRYCKGFFTLPGSSHRYRDWKPEGHGWMNLQDALAQSCDTYFYSVAQNLGIDKMSAFLARFGLGRATGIDIDGEKTGLVPSRDWKQRAFSRPADRIWFPGDTVIIGIGQGYLLTTPLQLAHMAATIGMRGKSFEPRLVSAIRDARTGTLRQVPPQPSQGVDGVDPARWQRIISGMVGVTSPPRGTARGSAAGAPYSIAGKTGTAQVFSVGQTEKYDEKTIEERLRDHALFVAFAPAEAPRIALAVLVENGRSGSGTAAPVARKVMDAYLIDPEAAAKTGEPAKAPPAAATPAVAAPAAAAPARTDPAPSGAAPDVSPPQDAAPAPEPPTLETPAPEASMPETPTPDAPAPDAPAPDTTTPDAATPEPPPPDAPDTTAPPPERSEQGPARHMIIGDLQPSTARRTLSASTRLLSELRLDGPLLAGICAIAVLGLLILYSASGQNFALARGQFFRLLIGLVAMLILARVAPKYLRLFAPWAYVVGVLLLLAVAVVGDIGKGAQRWLDLGVIRFQPSEMMKLAVPMMCAWYLHDRPLPPDLKHVVLLGIFILVPVALIAEQPDLGTALLIAASGVFVILLAGLRARVIVGVVALLPLAAWLGWRFLHDYQRKRVLTFLSPENDPLGAGYHIIQSQIAIGSGGVFGKGWMNGSQAQLEFLPERSTDFVFAVIGEEFGFLGLLLLLGLYLFVIGRGLFMALECQDTFARLVAGSISLTFFVYVFVNAGMVSGLLPVVGVPLPLVSFGGTSMVTLMAGFGILMSLHSHRKLVGS